MKGDLSRETFDPPAHYTAVRMQQGRVITDADFNEQGDITRHRAERLATDVIGASGAPVDDAGFALSAGMAALAVHAADANSVWIAGEDGVLLVSTNAGAGAGAAWTVASTGSTRHLRAIARAGNTGWAVGDGGTVLRSNNAGSSWTAQQAGSVQTLRGVAVFDAQHAWAVGDGGLVLRTVDGGANWTRHASGVDGLYGVAFSSAQNGLAVGRGGAIVRSTDGGQTWAAAPSGSTATLRAVALLGAQAWAVGDGGTALRSADGGTTWTAASSGSSATLRAVRFRDASTGWAAGDQGTLLASANGGSSWSSLSPGGSLALAGLSVAGTEAPWLVGGGSAWRVGTAVPGPADALALPAASLRVGPGRYDVQGQLCEWEQAASLANQPDGGVPARLAAGTHLVYLRAWQRHVSALEAPAIREVALGGPDTATRAQQVAQVRALALPASPTQNAWHCGADVAAWDALTAAPSARLAARAEPQLATTGVCEIAASAGYRRLENQLYRVEIHTGGTTPTFKWSRENGSVAYAVQEIRVDTATSQTTVRLAARGRDANLDLALHDRLELVDDAAELQQRAGTLFEYLNDGDDALELVLAGLPPGALGQDPARHPVLRRWDHRPAVAGENALALVEGRWITLEDGVQVRFSPGGNYRPGDYWQIPARTVTADVEWPRDGDGEPVAKAPAGVRDGWARLGLVTVDAAGLVSSITDCRDLFPPLTQMTQLLYVGGDGQHTTPGGALAEPLRVRVARGALPVPGARVRFGIEAGAGSLALVAPWGSQSGATVDAVCDAQGLAQCNWQLGTAAGQRVRAQLLTSGGGVVGEQQLVFAAQAETPAQGGGARGCEITIGEGGDFAELDSALLARLLKQHANHLCICFLPGTHRMEAGLELDGANTRPPMRLSLHGCGPTAVVQVGAAVTLTGLGALQLRDLQLQVAGRGVIALQDVADLRLEHVRILSSTDSRLPRLLVRGAGELRMADCEVASAPLASVVIDQIRGLCDIRHCRFLGPVSLFGMPGTTERLEELAKILQPGDFGIEAGGGRLVFSHNQLPRLTVGSDMLEALLARRVSGIFDTAVLAGNGFEQAGSICAARQLSLVGNHFTADRNPTGGRTIYGAMVCRVAAASGNVGEVFGDIAPLLFLQPKGELFRGAANAVFTLPQSTA